MTRASTVAGGTILEARDLTRRFGSRVAVNGVNLDVGAGEAVAVFGPNGAGKTTLLRMLSSALRPTSGAIRVSGHDLTRDPAPVRRRIGVIAHSSFLYDDLTVLENLAFFARLYGVKDPDSAARRWVDAMELSGREDDPAKTLSRGMTQRLAVARSLVHDPEIVYLDEPFSGLDPHAAGVLRETILRLRGERRTLVMVTHDLALGLALSDRWVLMRRGSVVDQGTSEGEDPRSFEERRFALAVSGKAAP